MISAEESRKLVSACMAEDLRRKVKIQSCLRSIEEAIIDKSKNGESYLLARVAGEIVEDVVYKLSESGFEVKEDVSKLISFDVFSEDEVLLDIRWD